MLIIKKKEKVHTLIKPVVEEYSARNSLTSHRRSRSDLTEQGFIPIKGSIFFNNLVKQKNETLKSIRNMNSGKDPDYNVSRMVSSKLDSARKTNLSSDSILDEPFNPILPPIVLSYE